MRRRVFFDPCIGVGLALLLSVFSANGLQAQHILLPRSYGATPISTIIHAQAAHIAAQGDFLISASIARRNDAIAVEQEIRNSEAWVASYFDKKRINQRYRAETERNYLQRQQMANQMNKSLVLDDFQIELKTDPTDKLNWMLRELNAAASDTAFVRGAQDSLVDSEFDSKLKTDDVHHIWFTDGGHKDGKVLTFHADSAEVLDIHWPRVMREPALDKVRTLFEGTRDEVLQGLRDTKELTYERQMELENSVNALSMAFNAAWPRDRRLESTKKYAEFTAGKKYVQSLAVAVCRIADTNDQRVFDGSYRFQGHGVAELINHMHRFGLEFSSPQPGDEGAYRELFFAMRRIYKHLADSALLNG